jgi:hypothetical protein
VRSRPNFATCVFFLGPYSISVCFLTLFPCLKAANVPYASTSATALFVSHYFFCQLPTISRRTLSSSIQTFVSVANYKCLHVSNNLATCAFYM